MALVGTTDDLDEFVYAGRPILPEKDSYSVTLQGGVEYSDIPGGMSKSQLQFYNSPYNVSVNYIGLDAFKIDYIENFLNRNRGQKFIAHLAISDSKIEPYVVQYLERGQVSKTGFNGSISLTLQVEPAVDTCFQQVIIDYGKCMGNPLCFWDDVQDAVSGLQEIQP